MRHWRYILAWPVWLIWLGLKWIWRIPIRKIPRFLLWLVWDFLSFRLIWERVLPPKRSPSTFVVWLVGIYTALFGLASAWHENAVDRVEIRAGAVVALLANDNVRKGATSQIATVQNRLVPEKPEFLNPLSLDSFWRWERHHEAVDLLKTAVVACKGELGDANLEGADLSGADLINANFTNANLSKADLREAVLVNANLERANLLGANLKDPNLKGANLKGANLVGGALKEVILLGTDLRNASLRNADLAGAILTNTNLNSADLVIADLSRARMVNASFEYAYLDRASLAGAIAVESNFTGAWLWSANFERLSQHNRLSLKGILFRNANLSNANFTGADLSDTDLTGSTLNGTIFSDTNLARTDLASASLRNMVIDNNTCWQDIESIDGAIIVGWEDMPIDFVVFAFLGGAEILDTEDYEWIVERERDAMFLEALTR
jgi:uncharacterized protein YjbI with pentapeptide repeats